MLSDVNGFPEATVTRLETRDHKQDLVMKTVSTIWCQSKDFDFSAVTESVNTGYALR